MTTQHNQTTLRVFAILEALLVASDVGASLSEIAAQTRNVKSTILRLLATLEHLDVVERTPTGGYRLGIGLLRFGYEVHRNLDLAVVAKPHLNELAEFSSETIHLGVRSGINITYIAKIESSGAFQMRSSVGTTMPLHSTGLGKAILANLTHQTVEQLYPNALPSRRLLGTDQDLPLQPDLTATRERGYSIDLEENEAGISCVGAPIFDSEDTAIAAVSVAAPSELFTPDRIAALGNQTARTATAISRKLGWRQHDSAQPAVAT